MLIVVNEIGRTLDCTHYHTLILLSEVIQRAVDAVTQFVHLSCYGLTRLLAHLVETTTCFGCVNESILNHLRSDCTFLHFVSQFFYGLTRLLCNIHERVETCIDELQVILTHQTTSGGHLRESKRDRLETLGVS